jgi:hypothetical protein
MSIVQPDISNMTGATVPVECPTCSNISTREGLAADEKHYLIESTHYHALYTEFQHLCDAINH